ncbi:MAG: hypothetical protein KDB60_05715 [Propionibacteriaceae bacterium]|nr:hypothetical protein [Propionibacteriaceae bacterium]
MTTVGRNPLGWLLVASLAIGGCAAAPRATTPPAPRASAPAPVLSPIASTTGAYLDFATCDPLTLHSRTGTTQIYFFYADDCAWCTATDAELLAHGVPDGITVFRVDLPSMPELADRYGVTAPGTFVQVDPSGAKVRSWTGSRDGTEIAAEVGD